MSSLIANFFNHGYCEGPIVINKDEINDLRNKLENYFRLKSYPIVINLFDIEDKNLIKQILKIYSSPPIKEIILNFNKFFKKKICIVPRFIIHRNYHVDRVKSPGIGWHRDCGGELKYNYCKKKLSSDSYFFAKLGIYLQKNSEYGGSIDVIPNSHKYIKFNNYIKKKISGSKLFFLIRFQKYFSYIYQLISEKIFMKILKAKTLTPKVGSIVLFDSRTVHRGTPIEDTVRKKVNFDSLNYSAQELPLEKVKFSFYVDIGSSLALDSYLYDRSQRINQKQKEIDALNYDLKKLEIFYPELAYKIKELFLPIIKKYN